jgi:hypothetical protein
MNDQKLYDRLARTDAYAPDLPLDDESWTPDVALAEIERRYAMQTDVRTTPTPSPRRPRGWMVAAAAFAVVVAIGIVVALVSTSGSDDVVDEPTTTTRAATSTTLAAAPDAATVRAAIVSYVDAINAGDAEAADAPFDLLDEGANSLDTPEHLRNHTEFLIELGWDFTVDDCLTDQLLFISEDITEVLCGLVVSSPIHEALGIDSVTFGSRIESIDALTIWHDPDSPVDMIVFLDNRVEAAYGNWMSVNDPDAFANICAPGAGGNLDEDQFAGSFAAIGERFIYTGACGAYLNSITADVVASIEAGG